MLLNFGRVSYIVAVVTIIKIKINHAYYVMGDTSALDLFLAYLVLTTL